MNEVMPLVGQIGVAGAFVVLLVKLIIELVKNFNDKKNGKQPAGNPDTSLQDIKLKLHSLCTRGNCMDNPQVQQSIVSLAVLCANQGHLEEALKDGLKQVVDSNGKQTEALQELRVVLAPLPGAIASLTLELRNDRAHP